MATSRNTFVAVVDGLVAGVIATWALDRVTTILYAREDRVAKAREEQVRGGQTASESAARKAAALAGRELTGDQASRYATAVHWLTGIGAGVAYALVTRDAKDRAILGGILFGTAFWAVIDEGANTALKLTPPPQVFPWQAHARGLAGHLAFGAAANRVLAVLNR